MHSQDFARLLRCATHQKFDLDIPRVEIDGADNRRQMPIGQAANPDIEPIPISGTGSRQIPIIQRVQERRIPGMLRISGPIDDQITRCHKLFQPEPKVVLSSRQTFYHSSAGTAKNARACWQFPTLRQAGEYRFPARRGIMRSTREFKGRPTTQKDMSTTDTGVNATGSEPTLRQMLALWMPLAASIAMMVLEPSIINIGLGRTSEAELALAAYGVAFGLALLVEAPILMLLDASVARSDSHAAFVLLRRLTLILSLAVAAIGLLVSLTPLYNLLVEGLMNIPTEVAARARPTLQVLSFWPLPIAWRRTHQGLLIRANHTTIISVATGVRLLTLAGGLFVGLLLLPERGALVAGLAMDLSVTIEAVLITLVTRSVLRAGNYGSNDPQRQQSAPSVAEIWHFYRPLLATTIIRQAMRPVLNAGIAAATMAFASLAAWPVAWGLATLITGPAWSLQQLTTALAVDRAAYRKVSRFALSLSVLFSIVMGLVVFTPIYGLVMGGIYNLSTDLQNLARPATQIMVLLPLVMGVQSLLRGLLIRAGHTGAVQSAMTINIATLSATLLVGVGALSLVGVTLAAIATLVGSVAEVVWLCWKTVESIC
jgi:hypothetical protein